MVGINSQVEYGRGQLMKEQSSRPLLVEDARGDFDDQTHLYQTIDSVLMPFHAIEKRLILCSIGNSEYYSVCR